MTRKWTVWAGVSALALVASGCSMEGALSAPDRAAEGRRVSGRLTEALEVPGASGGPARVALRDSAFAAHVRRGEAVAGAGVVAFARGARRERLRAEFVDSVTGRRFGIEAHRSAPGAPYARLRATVDGATLVDITRDWRPEGGLWVLDGERAVVSGAGGPLRVDRRISGVELAAAGPFDRLARAGFAFAASAAAPTELQAAQACWKEALEYAAATVVLAAATELVLASPEKIAAALVWLAAWERWTTALHKYATCMERGMA